MQKWHFSRMNLCLPFALQARLQSTISTRPCTLNLPVDIYSDFNVSVSDIANKMSNAVAVPCYRVIVNMDALTDKTPAAQLRLKEKYLPKYRRKLSMNERSISEPQEDRLSELTTRQIDRIIDMERIRCLLQDKKAKKGITYFQLDKQGNGFHANVYEAKFIAKINQIAIERNIRHENSEDFGESFGQRQAKCAAKDKNYNQAYKYSKKYHLKTKSIAKEEEEDYQSISEIESNLEEFEVNLPNKRNRRVKRTRAVTTSGLKMWFRGMSTRFLERDRCKTSKAEVHEEYQRMKGIDISSKIFQSQSNEKELPFCQKVSTWSTNLTNYSRHQPVEFELSERSSSLQPDLTNLYKMSRIKAIINVL